MHLHKKILNTSRGSVGVADTGGNGIPLILLHGLGASKEVFVEQFNSPLAEVHRIIAIDLPGHGLSMRSDDPQFDYTIPAVADLMAETLRMLGVERAVVFGWSLGGHIAIQMMHSHPDMLLGVMLAGVPPIGRGTWAMLRGFNARFEMLLGSKINLTQNEAERFATLCYGDACDTARIAELLSSEGRMRADISRSLVRGDGPDQRHIVETSTIPVAVLNGGRDKIVRMSYVENVQYANLWERRCHVIANAGHVPFLSTPNTFNTLLHRFVTDVALRNRDIPAALDLARSA